MAAALPPDPLTPPPARARRDRAGESGEAGAWLAAVALLLALWVLQPFRIPSASMQRTLQPGDFVLVEKLSAGLRVPFTPLRLPALRPPRRGDVLVFEAPADPGAEYVKRCIAVGGETIEIRDKRVIVNGETLAEPYAVHTDRNVRPGGYDYRDNFGPLTLAEGQCFVMGDNRDDSDDSRYWGPLPLDRVTGFPVLVYWSWDGRQDRPRWGRMLRWVR